MSGSAVTFFPGTLLTQAKDENNYRFSFFVFARALHVGVLADFYSGSPTESSLALDSAPPHVAQYTKRTFMSRSVY